MMPLAGADEPSLANEMTGMTKGFLSLRVKAGILTAQSHVREAGSRKVQRNEGNIRTRAPDPFLVANCASLLAVSRAKLVCRPRWLAREKRIKNKTTVGNRNSGPATGGISRGWSSPSFCRGSGTWSWKERMFEASASLPWHFRIRLFSPQSQTPRGEFKRACGTRCAEAFLPWNNNAS